VPPPHPADDREGWTGTRPLVTGLPVVIGAVVVGAVLIVLLASLGRQPDLVARLSQQYTGMMAGTLAPDIHTADPVKLADAFRRNGLPFTVRVSTLEPEFRLIGGRATSVDNRATAAWMYRAADAEMMLVEAFSAPLTALGPSDDRRVDRPPALFLYRKTTQTIVCWQDGPLVYALISTLPTEQVVRLARRAAAAVPPPASH
jgi:anti-sigma factor RsiW